LKTAESKSDSEFSTELPKTINIPDATIAYINGILLPVRWSTIDERNHKLYYSILYHNNENGENDTSYWSLATDYNNYNGTRLAEEMMEKMHVCLYDDQHKQGKFNIDCTHVDNQLKLQITDLRPVAEQYGGVAIVNIFPDEHVASNAME
jgi:hypothetical protein